MADAPLLSPSQSERPPSARDHCKSSEILADEQPIKRLTAENEAYEAIDEIDTKMEKIDIIGRINGKFGKWQLRTVLLIFLTKIPSAWFMACIIFTAPAPRFGEFFCSPTTDVLESDTWDDILEENKTQWIRISHPMKHHAKDGEITVDLCNVYADADMHVEHYFKHVSNTNPWLVQKRNASIVPCRSFVHDADYRSIITDYNLVCSRDILVATTQFFHLFGVLTGGLLATNLLKFFSPRSVMLFGMIAQIFCGNLTGLVDSYELHVFFRCLSAACCGQMYTAGQIIFADITDGKPKTIIITLFEQFWSIGVIILPAIASLVDSWSHLYMAISCPTLILIILWRWIPDSPRWLIAHNRIEEARDILIESAVVNKRSHLLPNDFEYLLQKQAQNIQSEPPPAGWWTLWKGPKAARHMICVHLCWSIYIVTYYGMLLNIRTFSREHLEMNTVIAASCEIVGVFCGLLLILFTTKKWLWTGLFNIIGGLVAYTAWLMPPEIQGNTRVALFMCTAMVSKIAISSTLAILTTCTNELVCAEKKKICGFSTVVWARCWLLTAPYIGATIYFGQLVPQTSLASLSIVGGILSMLISSPRTIPKTKHSNLPKELIPEIYTIKEFGTLDEKTKI